MKKSKILALLVSMLTILFVTCTSDPLLPPGGIQNPNGGNVPIVQDPGEEDLCPQGIISFQHEILPLLVSNCAFSGCHDQTSHKDDIILDSYENVIKEVTPNDLNDSELYESIIESDPDDIMPPPPYLTLSSEQIALIGEWILQGAENTTCGTVCDSTASSFKNDIFPTVESFCVGCHNTNFTQGNVNLENYNEIQPYLQDGAFIGSIRHDAGWSIMPPSGSKISDCRIAQIEKWIAEGAQDN